MKREDKNESKMEKWYNNENKVKTKHRIKNKIKKDSQGRRQDEERSWEENKIKMRKQEDRGEGNKNVSMMKMTRKRTR